jgi:hypothetical protein
LLCVLHQVPILFTTRVLLLCQYLLFKRKSKIKGATTGALGY